MPISQAFHNALTGMRVATRGADLVSSNVANSMTEGYGVRELSLSARDLGGYGAGVMINGVSRHSDPLLLGNRRLADAEAGADQTLMSALANAEVMIAGVNGEGGLAEQATALRTALTEATADPASVPRLTKVVDRLTQLSDGINDTAHELSGIRERAESDISSMVESVNVALREVDRLNNEIVRTKRGHGQMAGLYDQRQQVIDSISKIIPIKELSREGGRVALMTTDGEVLLDHRPRELGFVSAGVIAPEASVANGALHGITINGLPVTGGGPVGTLDGGALGAAFKVRDELVPELQLQLDQTAADLVSRLSDPAVDNTISGPGMGLLLSSATDPLNPPVGYATNLRVNPLLTATSTSATLLRDGMSGAPGEVGDTSRLTGWSAALDRSQPATPTSPSRSVAGNFEALSSRTSGLRITAEDRSARSTARQASYVEQEQAHGVDTDAEMQKLLSIEKIYAANAKVISVVDGMLRELMEI